LEGIESTKTNQKFYWSTLIGICEYFACALMKYEFQSGSLRAIHLIFLFPEFRAVDLRHFCSAVSRSILIFLSKFILPYLKISFSAQQILCRNKVYRLNSSAGVNWKSFALGVKKGWLTCVCSQENVQRQFNRSGI